MSRKHLLLIIFVLGFGAFGIVLYKTMSIGLKFLETSTGVSGLLIGVGLVIFSIAGLREIRS